MATKLNVVTGATGLLGSHLVEALALRGEGIRAVVRPTSDTTFLRELGVPLAVADLHDAGALRPALDGADIVYHCAAHVGDWGPWPLFQREVIDSTRNLLDACRDVRPGRVLYVSSVTVYGQPRGRRTPITEDEPLGQNIGWFWDYYRRSKILAEQLAWAYGPGLTVVRPSWIYGPRDRNSLPRVLAAAPAGQLVLIGSGDNLLNIVYAADVADGLLRAANHPGADGRAYNLCTEGEVTQHQFLDALTAALNLPRVQRHIPFWLAHVGGFALEALGHALGWRRPPLITRYAVRLVGRPTLFSIARARSELGWQPRVDPREGLRRSLAWWKERM